MMHLVIGGGVENQSKGANVPNKLRVNPKLEEKDKLRMDEKLRRRNNQSSGKVKPVCELEKPLEERLTEGRGQVELLTAVVNLMNSPQNPDLVTCSVEPVVSQINKDSSEDPCPWRIPGKVNQSVVGVNPTIRGKAGSLAEKSDHCHEEAERYAGYTIRNVVPFAIFPIIIIIREAIH